MKACAAALVSLLLPGLAHVSLPASAADSSTPVDALCRHIQVVMLGCQMRGETAIMSLQSTDFERTDQCAKDGKEKSRALYVAAREATTGNKDVQPALKDLYADFLAFIDTATPSPSSESRQTYRRRMEAASGRFKQLCLRMSLDL